MSEKLLPCPFCGDSDVNIGTTAFDKNHEAWFPDGTRIRKAYFVCCSKCTGASSGFIGDQTEELAAKKWNTRATDPVKDKLYTALVLVRHHLPITSKILKFIMDAMNEATSAYENEKKQQEGKI